MADDTAEGDGCQEWERQGWTHPAQLGPYWYAREHDGSGWSVRGPDGFVIKLLAGMDKNVAYIIAKLLSEQWDDADALLHDFARMMRRRS